MKRALLSIRKRIKLNVEVAEGFIERMLGLMFRESIGRDQGMLFVFPHSSVKRFWMWNMCFPVDIASIGEDKRIKEVSYMDTRDRNQYTTKTPARYALETARGVLKKAGVRRGDVVTWTLQT